VIFLFRPPSERRLFHSREKEQARAKATSKLNEQSSASCGFIVLINLLFVFTAILFDDTSLLVLVMVSSAFVFGGIQMVMSLIWFLGYFFLSLYDLGAWFLTKLFCCRHPLEPPVYEEAEDGSIRMCVRRERAGREQELGLMDMEEEAEGEEDEEDEEGGIRMQEVLHSNHVAPQQEGKQKDDVEAPLLKWENGLDHQEI